MSKVIELTREWTKSPLARSVPGAWMDPERKAWVIKDPSPRGATVALKLFPELALAHPSLADERDKLAQDVRPMDYATELGLSVGSVQVRQSLDEDDKAYFEFQDVDLGYLSAVLLKHGGAYLGWERGLGKTLGAAALIDDTAAQHTLVVAPNTAKTSVWKPELEKWLPHMPVLVLPNEKDKREATMRSVQQLMKEHDPFILIVHYEALDLIATVGRGKKNKSGWDKYGTWDLVIADEAHRIKNPKALMSKALKRIKSKARLALSGSIIENHAEELFSPLQWLFPETYKAKWRDWNDRFLDFIDSGYGKVCVGIKNEKLDELRQELGVFMAYRRKEDELDLPERTEQVLKVQLKPAQRRAYNELRDTCITQLDDDTKIKAAEGLTMLTRLRQIATGLDLFADEVSDSSKQDLAIELIEDNEDEAFVVFTWFKRAGRTLQQRLEAKGTETFLIDGDVKNADRTDQIERFQGGEGRVFIGTLSTLGESVTLHRASNAIFLDRSWNPATNAQAADRIYRIGQSRPVTITDIVAEDTVDELRVSPTVANKQALRAMILGGK